MYGCVSTRIVAAAVDSIIREAEHEWPVIILRTFSFHLQHVGDSRFVCLQEFHNTGVPREVIADRLVAHNMLAAACLTRGQAFRRIAAAVDSSFIYEASFRRFKLTQ